jgi:hypothetical protein
VRGVFRRIFWPKRDKATGEWRKLHNEEVHDLFPSPTIVRVIKSISFSRRTLLNGVSKV